eukprot:5006971-Amphidinium_carterae.2
MQRPAGNVDSPGPWSPGSRAHRQSRIPDVPSGPPCQGRFQERNLRDRLKAMGDAGPSPVH